MAGRPSSEPCPTSGCLLSKEHAGNCTTESFQSCEVWGCTLRKGHGGPCNSNE